MEETSGRIMQSILDRILELNIVIGVPIVCAGFLMLLVGLIYIPRAKKPAKQKA
jgi:hypothetical protein